MEKLTKEEALEKLRGLISPDTSGWLEKAQWKQDNDYWIGKSQDIAMTILKHLRKSGMTREELASQMNLSDEELHDILRGHENLSLKTIGQLEEIMGIQLINTELWREDI